MYQQGLCTFAPFRRRRQSKTNCHQPHPTFHYSFGTSIHKSKSGSQISLFVWNLRSHIEKRKPIVQNELSLATAHFFAICFGTSFPKSKRGSYIYYLFWNFRSQIKKRKLIYHNLFWNKSKSRASLVFGTRLPNQSEDAKTEIRFIIPYGSGKSQRH